MGSLLHLDFGTMSEPHALDLWRGLLVLASEGHMEGFNWSNFIHSAHGSAHLCSRLGHRLVYLLMSLGGGVEDLLSELSRAMASTVCDGVFTPALNAQTLHRLWSTTPMFSKRFQNRDVVVVVVEDVRLYSRLLGFVLKDGEFFFHSLCALGVLDLVEFAVEVMSPATRTRVFAKLDRRHMSPLYLATANGHLEVLKVLLDNGCPLTSLDAKSTPEVFAAVVCLQSSFSSSWRRETMFWMSPECSLALRKSAKRLVPGESHSFHGGVLPTRSALMLRERAADIIVLFASTIQEDSIARAVSDKDSFAILASLPSLCLASPLLERFHLFFHQNEPTNACFLELREVTCMIIELLPKPRTCSRDSLLLLEDILLRLVDWDRTTAFFLDKAACRGLWGLVEKSLDVVPHSQLLQSTTTPADVSEAVLQAGRDTVAPICIKIISEAILQGELDAVASICKALQASGVLRSRYLTQPLRAAVRLDRTDLAAELLLSCDVDAIDVFTPLSSAVRLHRHSAADLFLDHLASKDAIERSQFHGVVRAAATNNNSRALGKLFALSDRLCGGASENDAESEFWRCVLSAAVERGHEQLALQALGGLSEQQLGKMEEEEETYSALLCWCCHWGMRDVLECLACSEEAILTPSTNHGVSPWASAVFGGHVGKLSHLDCFPSLHVAMETGSEIMDAVEWNLFDGVFHKLLSSGIKEVASRHKFSPSPNMVTHGVRCGMTSMVGLYFDHLGKYAGEYIMYLAESRQCSLLHVACSQRNNLPMVELILKRMFDSPTFSSYDLSSELAVSALVGEVGYVRAFIRCRSGVFAPPLYQRVLMCAVRSNSPEMVDYVLELLGGWNAPDVCFEKNEHSECPLYAAFALGRCQVVTKSTLLAVAAKSPEFHRYGDWRGLVDKAVGWFDVLMRNNAALVSSADPDLNSPSSASHADTPLCNLASLRSKAIGSHYTLLDLLYLAVKFQHSAMIEALLSTSDGVFFNVIWEKETFRNSSMLSQLTAVYGVFSEALFQKTIVDPAVRQFLDAKDYGRMLVESLELQSKNSHVRDWLIAMNGRCGFERETLASLELFGLMGDGELLEGMYASACVLGKAKLVECLPVESFPDAVKQRGMQCAAEFGHFKMVAGMALRLNLQQHPSAFESLNAAHWYVFGDQGYDAILNGFFSSLSSSPGLRMPLAALWVARGWSEEEAQRVITKLSRSTYAPPNPWTFSSPGGDLAVTVDWDAFSECLLTSPSCADAASKFRHTPLLVESIIFSPAVLGQLSPRQLGPRTTQNSRGPPCLFDYCVREGISSVIVSCVVWPVQPSFLKCSEDQATLTFSYHPRTRTVEFTDLESLEDKDLECVTQRDAFADSPVARLCQRLESLREHYREVLGVVALCREATVSVNFSLGDLSAQDRTNLEFYCALLSTHLSDTVEALNLLSKPSVLYQHLYQSPPHRAAALAPVPSRGFDAVVVNFQPLSCENSTHLSTTIGVTLDRSVLRITMQLCCDEEAKDFDGLLEFQPRTGYSKLVDTLSPSVLEAELSCTRNLAQSEIGGKIAPLLASSLKISSLAPDFLEIVVKEPEDGGAAKLSELDVSQTKNHVYFKSLHHLEKFLGLFCRMLKVFHYRPRLHALVRSCFENGLQVMLTKSSKSEFVVQAGFPCLIVSMHVLLSGNARSSLLPLFRDVQETICKTAMKSSPFSFARIPAPFVSFVDLSSSVGLLYPVKRLPGEITVQMVDFCDVPIQTTLTVDSCLDVRIEHLSSRSIVVASSSVELSRHSDSTQLLVTGGSEGVFKIRWTPQESGLYLVSIRLNGVPVMSSPYKCLCADSGYVPRGARQTTTDAPIVCVVSHSLPRDHTQWAWQCQAATPSPVRLLNKKAVSPAGEGRPDGSRDDFIQQLQDGREPVHHISMCSAYGKARKWFRVSSPFVSIHLSEDSDSAKGEKWPPAGKFSLDVVPLGKGRYQISLAAKSVGSFSVFASCACCNAVLTMHWREERSFLPTPLYLLPGRFYAEKSLLTVLPPNKRSHQRTGNAQK